MTLAAYLAHYPLSKAIAAHAAGEPLPRWELHPVDVEAARPWADMLHTLRRARPAVAFPGVVDDRPLRDRYDTSIAGGKRAGGIEVIPPTGERYVKDGYTVTYVSSDTNLADVDSVRAVADVDIDSPQPVDKCADPACRGGEIQYPEWEGETQPCPICNKIAVPDERTANVSPVEQPAGGATPSAPPAQSLDNPKEYDVDKFDRPILPPADEGDNADPAAITALKARYAALEADGRAWVNAIAKQAQAAGGALSLADSQPQTIRRFEAMRALVLLAEGGFADEQAVRGILRAILGDVADSRLYTLGKLVAHLDQHDAARFAELADTVANGAAALAITQPDGRYVWEFAA